MNTYALGAYLQEKPHIFDHHGIDAGNLGAMGGVEKDKRTTSGKSDDASSCAYHGETDTAFVLGFLECDNTQVSGRLGLQEVACDTIDAARHIKFVLKTSGEGAGLCFFPAR